MRRLWDRLSILKLNRDLSTAMHGKDELLRKCFGVIYKKAKMDNFRLLCADAEKHGFTQAMEAYGQIVLRLAGEIQNEAQ